MKILFLIRSLENGGAERQLALLANALASKGHSVAIGVFYSGGANETVFDGVRLIDLRKGSRLNMLGFSVNLLRVVRAEKPDVIHGYLSAGNLAATLGQFAWPKSQLVWGIRDGSVDARNYGKVTQLAAHLLRFVSRRAELMIFNSQAGQRHWTGIGHAAARSVCVPNGIDCGEFFPDPAAGLRFRQSCGISASVPLVGMVARFDPAKDHAGFLKAAALLLASGREAHFLCLGEGPAAYRASLQALAGKLGIAHKVFWPSPTREMRAVYNAMDVFCLASHSEGFPNVVAEAMACDRPCVVTDTGDAAFIVGLAGTVVPKGDVNALAGAIQAALDDPIRHPSPRERIASMFAIEAMATRTEHAFLTTASGSEISVAGAGPIL